MASLIAEIQRSSRTLRPVAKEHVKDCSAPRIHDVHTEERQQVAHETYYLDLGLDKWIPLVCDLTFETVSLPLSPAEAMLLRRCYKSLHGSDRATSPGRRSAASLHQPCLCTEDLNELVALGRRIEPELASIGDVDGAFVKLSGRSSKDAPLHTVRLRESCGRLASDEHGVMSAVVDKPLLLLFQAALRLMQVSCVPHALWLLINSDRVDEDLEVALRHQARTWDQSVVLRRWWPGVTVDLEFRMFVVDHQPTGLTQYNHLLYSPRVAKHKDVIGPALLTFFATHVAPRLRGRFLSRYVVDLAIDPEALTLAEWSPNGMREGHPAVAMIEARHIKLIELNCFYEATGMGLFDFHADAVTLSGQGDFEFRVLTEPLPHPEVRLEREWRDILSPTRGEGGVRMTDEAWEQIERAFTEIPA